MRIIIIGCGKVGEKLCMDLADAGHDIILIEKNADRLNKMITQADLTGFVGNGALNSTQMEAGVADANMLIAVTPDDETNMIAAITAKINGVGMVIARVRDPNYTEQMNFLRQKLGVDRLINPELQAARAISQILQFPEAITVDEFANGQVYVVELLIPKQSPIVGMKIRDIRHKFNSIIVCCMARKDGQVLIPVGDTVMEAEDHINITGNIKDLNLLYDFIGMKQPKINRALIIGGGLIARYLIPRLLRADIRVKIIDKDVEAANQIASDHPRVEVVIGDGTDQDFLKEQHIEQYGAVISLTGIDEENLLVGLFAERQNVKKIIAKINRTNLIDLLPTNLAHSIITPKSMVADEITRLVRARDNSEGSHIEFLYRMMHDQVEAMQFFVTNHSKCTGIPLAKLPIKNNIQIAYIYRNRKLIFPSGNDTIQPQDSVIIFTTNKNFNVIDDILIN